MIFSLIPSRIHGVLDYLSAAFFIFFPWVYGISNYTFGSWLMIVAGVLVIIYSLMTRYESGYIGLISMRTHLLFDLVIGISLVALPYAFHRDETFNLPNIISGIVIIIIALCTNTKVTRAHGPKLSPKGPMDNPG